MKKHLFILIFGSLFIQQAISQSLNHNAIAASGNHVSGASASLSWTLGELAIQTIENTSSLLTQGFHQGELEAVSIEDFYEVFGKIEIYPNPSAHFLYIERTYRTPSLFLELIDLSGKSILQKQLRELKGQINLEQLSSGIYMLHLSDGAQSHHYITIQKQ